MFEFRILGAAVAAAGLLAALPAAAVVKIATYTGTVSAGYDTTGVFGAADTSLAGASWVSVYTYDATLGGSRNTDGVSFDESVGGSAYGTASPIISSTITINGATRSIGGRYVGDVYTSTRGFVEHLSMDFINDDFFVLQHELYNYGTATGAPASLDRNFGPATATAGQGYVLFSLFYKPTNTQVEQAYAFLFTDAAYTVRSAVPEPASWALMITGFGMVGAALRRTARQQARTVAAQARRPAG